jgi:hypothetical protein
MLNNNPTFKGPGTFKTRMPVGKISNRFKGIPRLGNKLNVPVFGNRPTPIQQLKVLTPAFKGPAKLPSNFMKNIPGLGIKESSSSRGNMFNQPLRRIPKLGHPSTVRKTLLRKKKR